MALGRIRVQHFRLYSQIILIYTILTIPTVFVSKGRVQLVLVSMLVAMGVAESVLLDHWLV